MYYEFYIDIFFLENMMLDYIVLALTGSILKWKRDFRLLFLAAFTGALGACMLMVSPFRGIPAVMIAGYVLPAVLMVRIAYGISQKHLLAKGLLCFSCTAFLTGGIFQAVSAQFSFSVPTAAFVSAGVLTVFLRGYQGVKFKTQNFYDVTLGFHGKTVCVRALRDTGNQLKDPLTGKPVSILAYDAARGLLDKDAKMFYIPFHSIGKSSGLLPGMTLDYMNIRREKDLQRLERPVIAVSKEPVNRDGKYQLILHPQLLDE